jgi:hypothetical protein
MTRRVGGQPVERRDAVAGDQHRRRMAGEPERQVAGVDVAGDFWRFRCEDNGIGIDAEYADRIFVIFQRLHPRAPRKDGREVRSYDLHANAYVTKPVDFNRFIEVVRQIDEFFVTVVKLPGHVSPPGS